MNKTESLNQYRKYLQPRVSGSTADLYIYAMRRYFVWLGKRQPSKRSAQMFLDSMLGEGISASRIHTYSNAIIKWFKWKGIDIRLDLPKLEWPEPKYIKAGDVNRMLEASTGIEYAIIALLYDSAVRVSELLGIRSKDIDYTEKTISVRRKGGRRDIVNLSDTSMELLGAFAEDKDENEPVFPMSYQEALTLVKNAGKRIGVRATPHLLRHSRAIQMLNEGADIWVVSQHLGHTNINTTANVYGKFKKTDLRSKIPECV